MKKINYSFINVDSKKDRLNVLNLETFNFELVSKLFQHSYLYNDLINKMQDTYSLPLRNGDHNRINYAITL